MPMQPMGSGSGGQPGVGSHNAGGLDKATLMAEADHQNALLDSSALIQDLLDSPGIAVVAQALEGRINEFLKTDPAAMALIRVIAAWRSIIEVAPRLAAEKVERLMGPQLAAVKRTHAAP